MTRVLHISDPHFGTEQEPVVEALVRCAHVLKPELVVLSGDITQRARRAQFRAARAFVDRLGAPALIAIPGNHDISVDNLAMRLVAPYAGYRASFGAELEPVYSSDHLLVIAVNTTRWWRHIDGEVSLRQVERVAALLEQATPAQQRIVVVHQPIGVTRPRDEADLLGGRIPAVRRWSEAGADMVLGGHIHLPYVLPLHERHGGLPRKLWAVQAGTSVSARLRHEAENSFNLLQCDADGGVRRCAVEQWDWSAGLGEFARVRSQTLECDS